MRRTRIVLCVALMSTCFLLTGCGGTRTAVRKHHGNIAATRIAKAYGLDHFHKVEAIRYTFNAVVSGKKIQRSWVWHPKSGQVIYKGKNASGKQAELTYNRRDQSDPSFDAAIDQWFINDQYWLLFPLHLEWDPDITVTSDGRHPLPILPGRANRITVRYPPDAGYTPGDIYELYYSPNYMIRQWVYRKGGSEEPTRTATWEHHAKVGPILIALMHKGGDENFKVWFSDVGVRLTGNDAWLPPLIF